MKHLRGFTLMEMLVTLIISALAVTMMFQTLISFNVARQRVAALESVRDNQMVWTGWVGDSIRGLVAISPASLHVSHHGEPITGLTGNDTGFTASTVTPLFGAAGIATVIRWRIEQHTDATVLVYEEPGHVPLVLPIHGPAHFTYLDANGTPHSQWPLAQGLTTALPHAVELTYTQDGQAHALITAIAAPQPTVLPPYSMEAVQ